jgi:uncharacterized membrane protein
MKDLFVRLQESKRLPIIVIFCVTTILCVTLVALRVQVTSRITFTFLVWNIFLALIPYIISTLLVLFHTKIKHRGWLWLPFMAWLCFFPNAPYILTDLFHLKPRAGVPYWYDLALILFFAWNGLMLGFASMMDIQEVFSKRYHAWIGWMISIGSLILGGFGIYLGRYLRWNSWDIITSPTGLLKDIASRILNPFSHPQTYGVTILFSAFLVLGYVLLLQFSRVYARK